MKNLHQNSKKWVGISVVLILLMVSLSSCLKNDYNDNIQNQPVALVSVINASTDSQPLNFFLDNNLVNAFPIGYSHGLDYFRAIPGTRVASFFSADNQQKIVSDTVSFTANNVYSLFLANSVNKPDVILLSDSVTAPAAGMATVRLVNVSATAPSVDLAVTGGAVITANKAYKGSSSFIPVTGNSTYNFEIRKSGTATVLATLPNITLRSGSEYTIWLHGNIEATDNTKLQADIITNAVY